MCNIYTHLISSNCTAALVSVDSSSIGTQKLCNVLLLLLLDSSSSYTLILAYPDSVSSYIVALDSGSTYSGP